MTKSGTAVKRAKPKRSPKVHVVKKAGAKKILRTLKVTKTQKRSARKAVQKVLKDPKE